MALGCDKIQGYFTSTGVNVKLNIPIEADTCNIWNYTQAAAAAPTAGVQFRWQEGMVDYGGITYRKAGSNVLQMTTNVAGTNPGFLLFNDADNAMSAPIAIDGAVSNAAQISITTSDTGDLVNGDTVILYNVLTNFKTQGFPFQVSNVVADTSFTIAWPLANAPGSAGTVDADTAFRIVYASPRTAVRPTNNFVINVSQAAQAVVTFSVAHNYQVGQTVRFTIPNLFGMTELDGRSATIVAINTTNNTITIDLNTIGFSPFVWLGGNSAVTGNVVVHDWATSSPAYMNTAAANQFMVDPYSDARFNLRQRGLVLFGGAASPAGQNGDLIFWEVTSSTTDYITLPTL